MPRDGDYQIRVSALPSLDLYPPYLLRLAGCTFGSLWGHFGMDLMEEPADGILDWLGRAKLPPWELRFPLQNGCSAAHFPLKN